MVMRKSNFFVEEYAAPELEVVSAVVEAGFDVSANVEFEGAGEETYGPF